GYPNAYPKGDVIKGLPEKSSEGFKVFHAGTALNENGDITTAGGRVLCACALGDDLQIAQTNAYKLVQKISWDQLYYRTDIGFKAIS
ncbi:MAG: phosphoribosylamine--glycine ligase, partial [Methylococcales bacterium]|nr:phosphoribosylamine--glycine ligase [Methylococcales bacterium]